MSWLIDNTLQRTATHSNTLRHTATHCSALQHTAAHCNTLQRTATHCGALQHTAVHCNTLQHTTRQWQRRDTLEAATCCNTLQCFTRICMYIDKCVYRTALYSNLDASFICVSRTEMRHSYVCHGTLLQLRCFIHMCVTN